MPRRSNAPLSMSSSPSSAPISSAIPNRFSAFSYSARPALVRVSGGRAFGRRFRQPGRPDIFGDGEGDLGRQPGLLLYNRHDEWQVVALDKMSEIGAGNLDLEDISVESTGRGGAEPGTEALRAYAPLYIEQALGPQLLRILRHGASA